MIHKNYENGILYFSNNGKDYKVDYDINIERLDGQSCIGEFSLKMKVQVAQRLVICKGITDGQIKDITLESLINKSF